MPTRPGHPSTEAAVLMLLIGLISRDPVVRASESNGLEAASLGSLARVAGDEPDRAKSHKRPSSEPWCGISGRFGIYG